MNPEISALIARKKIERTAKGFGLRVKYDNGPDFTAYYVDKATYDEMFARASAQIGKRHRSGIVTVAVEQITA